MNVIAVDDEAFALHALTRAVREAVPDAVLHSYGEVSDLMEDLKKNAICPDVAFLDIEMSDLNGLELAKRIKMVYPKVNIIFVTGFSQYALDAYTLRPSGYLTKPVTREDILNELQNLRCPPERTKPAKPISIRCFGNFEVRHNGTVVSFLRTKSMEVLAYLVSRQGNLASMSEIANILWEDGIYDRSRQKQLSVIRHDLIKTLDEYGISHLLSVSRNAMAVVPDAFDCDYYMMLAGDSTALNSFHGEFMLQYSWAEMITAELTASIFQ
ncbi:MAG: response regulator [bacterium]|nr:response regulator [bacterium]